MQALFAEVTEESMWAAWELVAEEKAWFNWIGQEWHQWCDDKELTPPAATGDTIVPGAYHADLAAKQGKLARTARHEKMKQTLAGAPKSKYNPKKGGKEKLPDHPVKTVLELNCG
jgi:hypothetical protein